MLHHLTRQVGDWLKLDRDIRRLRRLDDRLLADLGIERHNIPPFVKGRTR